MSHRIGLVYLTAEKLNKMWKVTDTSIRTKI